MDLLTRTQCKNQVVIIRYFLQLTVAYALEEVSEEK